LVKRFSEVFLREASGEGASVVVHTRGSVVAGNDGFGVWGDAKKIDSIVLARVESEDLQDEWAKR
jgi:hypothetical protein